jgi:hypothetical protein
LFFFFGYCVVCPSSFGHCVVCPSTKENRKHNGQKKTDKTMVKRKQTKQWSKENRQHNVQKKTDNTIVKRKQTTQ